MRSGPTAMHERRLLFATARFLSRLGLSAFPYGPTQPRATSGPLHHQLAILLRMKQLRRMHRPALRESALARVLECDMRSVSCGFVSLVSAESTSSWRIRSVAEHGWFGSGHRESQCSFGNSRLGFGIGIWDLGFANGWRRFEGRACKPDAARAAPVDVARDRARCRRCARGGAPSSRGAGFDHR